MESRLVPEFYTWDKWNKKRKEKKTEVIRLWCRKVASNFSHNVISQSFATYLCNKQEVISNRFWRPFQELLHEVVQHMQEFCNIGHTESTICKIPCMTTLCKLLQNRGKKWRNLIEFENEWQWWLTNQFDYFSGENKY